MVTKSTFNIVVSVTPEYDSRNSFPSENRFVFKYTIVIENKSDDVIKVLKRKWLIHDVGYGYTEVLGDGVIGLTPEIKPGDSFSYFSNVVLRSGTGNMEGKYLVSNLLTDENFEVDIPKFELISEVFSN